MDNYGTHSLGAFYEAFPPEEAKALIDRFCFVYTPKHGSWLNMAEIVLNVMQEQCLNRRIADFETLTSEVSHWVDDKQTKSQYELAVYDPRFTRKVEKTLFDIR